jgi:hypothetical protein
MAPLLDSWLLEARGGASAWSLVAEHAAAPAHMNENATHRKRPRRIAYEARPRLTARFVDLLETIGRASTGKGRAR